MEARVVGTVALMMGILASPSWLAFAGEEQKLLSDPDLEAQVKASIDVGLKYLRFEQDEDGSWNGDPRTTALILRALMESHRRYTEEDGPFIRRALEFLAKAVEAEEIDTVEEKAAVARALSLATTPHHREMGVRLARELVSAQQQEGYWMDDGPDPLENDRFAASAFALLALERFYGN